MKKLEMSESTLHRVLELIPNTREEAISVKTLCELTGYSHMTIKGAVHFLRKKYAICAQDIGGYWIAEDESQILEFIQNIASRRDSYNITISNMHNRLMEMKNNKKG